LPQAGRAPRRVTNFRDDRTLRSAFWRESFNVRRCLVPASSFAEPAEVTPATWHWFAMKPRLIPAHQVTAQERPLFAFAGIWRRWQGPIRKAGPEVCLDVYSFMTTMPNSLVATINHERMPVLLRTEQERTLWLTGSPEAAIRLAAPAPPEVIQIVQEGFEKQDFVGADHPQAEPSQPRLI
ncbi:MAG: SOS response-associated peptidase family protein, partial [Hyphomicrobiaceae bacterium]